MGNTFSTERENTGKDELFLDRSSANGKQCNLKTGKGVRPIMTEEQGTYFTVKQTLWYVSTHAHSLLFKLNPFLKECRS